MTFSGLNFVIILIFVQPFTTSKPLSTVFKTPMQNFSHLWLPRTSFISFNPSWFNRIVNKPFNNKLPPELPFQFLPPLAATLDDLFHFLNVTSLYLFPAQIFEQPTCRLRPPHKPSIALQHHSRFPSHLLASCVSCPCWWLTSTLVHIVEPTKKTTSPAVNAPGPKKKKNVDPGSLNFNKGVVLWFSCLIIFLLIHLCVHVDTFISFMFDISYIAFAQQHCLTQQYVGLFLVVYFTIKRVTK